MAGRYNVTVSPTLNELRVIIKSLSIGCTQLGIKMERLSGTSRFSAVAEEFAILTNVKMWFEQELVDIINEVNGGLEDGLEDDAL